MNKTEDAAYQEMTDACRLIVGNIKQYPALLDQLCAEVELALITIALKRSDGNCTKAAKLLGLNRTTLVEKRRKLGMSLGTYRRKRS